MAVASVKEAVKESLVGTNIDEPTLSKQVRANFQKHARKDDQTGEYFMTEEDFVDAIQMF